MELSRFGQKITARTGILELMDDLGSIPAEGRRRYMLGGGNPARIPQVEELWRRRMGEILNNGDQFERMIGVYDSSQGNERFLTALADMMAREYGWRITPKNIAVTNGSQTAFYCLINMLCGTGADGVKRKILFPISPEYIGYADQSIEDDSYISCRPAIEEIDDLTFKYHIDFQKLYGYTDLAAVCVSRPTNPTGNVLTDDELIRLADFAGSRTIPLIIDNAYGLPFPGIMFEDVEPYWNENVILGMSLSKIGLPSVRNGIVIAAEEIIEAMSASNAVLSLSTGSIGQEILAPVIASGELVQLSKEIITPFYRSRAVNTVRWIREAFDGICDYSIHKAEGAFFLWIWFKDLPITTAELYRRFKKEEVFVIPGCHFFFGLEEEWKHRDECIRITYSQDEESVREGIRIMADVIRGL